MEDALKAEHWVEPAKEMQLWARLGDMVLARNVNVNASGNFSPGDDFWRIILLLFRLILIIILKSW